MSSGQEGLAHWATLGQSCDARSAMGNQLMRALKHDGEARAMYMDLPDTEKIRFRKNWSVKKSFQFVKESRMMKSKSSKSSTERGVYLTPLQIAAKLGGAQFAIARKQAKSYCLQAAKVAGKFVCTNEWLKSKQYLFIERLLESSTTEEWIQISEGYTECNEWEELGKEHRAKKKLRSGELHEG